MAAVLEPDPMAPMPSGISLAIPPARTSAPLIAGRQQLQAQGVAGFGGVKPLRPPKSPPPRATRIDPNRMLSPSAPSARALRLRGPGAPLPPAGAPAVAAMPVVTTLEGGSDDGTTIPPDTQAAASTTHIINPLNNNIHVIDLANPSAPTVVALDAFWSRPHCFDPKVVYDPNVDRFVFVVMADAAQATSSFLVAVSASGDATGQWHFQSVAVDPAVQGQVWMDYPSLGLTADKVTVQVNLYTLAAPHAFAGSSVYVFDKTSLMTPASPSAVTRFMLPNQGAGQVPAVTYDPGVQDQFLVSSWSGNAGGQGSLAVWKITGSPANNTTAITRVGFVPAAGSWNSFPSVAELAPQSGIADRLDVGDDRLLSVVNRGGTLYGCHTVYLPTGAGTRSAVQWWEISTASWSASLGLLDDPAGATFYAFPSMAINKAGDILIGHARFSTLTHPSGAYLLVPAGGGAQVAAVFAPGQATYVQRFGGPKNRWGDYSATQVDHRDDASFWTIQEYASPTADKWATKIAKITPPPAPPIV